MLNMVLSFFCRIGLHWWRVVHDNGKTVYEECNVRGCGKRRAWQRWPGIGAQPIDWNWVQGADHPPCEGPVILPRGGSTSFPQPRKGGQHGV